jgi:ACS family glucarate transporter-like MFS transporter
MGKRTRDRHGRVEQGCGGVPTLGSGNETLTMALAETVARPTNVRWRILAWIVVASLVAYILRFNLSVAGPAMMHDLGLSETQLGIILGAFAWTYGLLQVPSGMVGERVGPRRSMTLIFVAWFGTTVLMAAVPHAWPVAASVSLLFVLRAAQGAVQAPIFPVTSGGSMFAWLPPRSWALGNGLGAAGTTVGAALAGPGVTWLVIHVGWRQSFVIVAPLGLLLAAGWWWDYRDDPSAHRAVNREELELIRSGRDAHTGVEAVKWTRLLADRDLLCVTLSYFFMNYVFYLFFNWFFYYLSEIRHVPATLSGYFVGAQWMVGAVTALLGGITCDRLSVRFGARFGCRATAFAGLLMSVPLLIAGTLATNAVTNVVLLSLSFGCTQFVDCAYWTAAMRIAGPQAQSATGMLNTGGNVAGGLGAVLVPAIAAHFGWTVAVGSGAMFSLIAALLWFGVRPDILMQSRA